MNLKKSLENIEKILTELCEENQNIPILVEGEKDIKALNKLRINGVIISINKGTSLTDFCDRLVQEYEEVIILVDWDKKGGRLCRIIKKNLRGRVKYNTKYRKALVKNAMIRTVEGLPSWIETMRNKLNLIE